MGKMAASEAKLGCLFLLFCRNAAPRALRGGDPGIDTPDSESFAVYRGCSWQKLERFEAEARWISVLRLLSPKVRSPVVT